MFTVTSGKERCRRCPLIPTLFIRLNRASCISRIPGTRSQREPPLPRCTRRSASFPSLGSGQYAYKALYTGFDLATLGVLLLILASLQQPLHRGLTYAWNPTVLISFSLCGHQDSLAIFTLMLAYLLIISRKPLLSNVFLAFSFASKFFALLFLPLFLNRRRWASSGVFAGVVVLCYLPFASAGWKLFHGLSNYAAGWEGNDSLFRLVYAASASKAQAEFVAGVLVLAAVAGVIRARMPLLRA